MNKKVLKILYPELKDNSEKMSSVKDAIKNLKTYKIKLDGAATIKGEKGEDGIDGKDGIDGVDGKEVNDIKNDTGLIPATL